MILNVVEISSLISLEVSASVLHDSNLPGWNMPWIHRTFPMTQEYKKLFKKKQTKIIDKSRKKWVTEKLNLH